MIGVSGWRDRVEGVTAEDHWIAAIENATPERVAGLRERGIERVARFERRQMELVPLPE